MNILALHSLPDMQIVSRGISTITDYISPSPSPLPRNHGMAKHWGEGKKVSSISSGRYKLPIIIRRWLVAVLFSTYINVDDDSSGRNQSATGKVKRPRSSPVAQVEATVQMYRIVEKDSS